MQFETCSDIPELTKKKISVIGTGMGCASIGITAMKLIHHYGVKNLIRIGSCGSEVQQKI